MSVYLEMMRPNNGVLAILGILIGAIVAGTFSVSYVILFALVVSFLINSAGTGFNDILNNPLDK